MVDMAAAEKKVAREEVVTLPEPVESPHPAKEEEHSMATLPPPTPAGNAERRTTRPRSGPTTPPPSGRVTDAELTALATLAARKRVLRESPLNARAWVLIGAIRELYERVEVFLGEFDTKTAAGYLKEAGFDQPSRLGSCNGDCFDLLFDQLEKMAEQLNDLLEQSPTVIPPPPTEQADQ